MAKLALNKNELQKKRDQLKLYRRVLPSLDMKRQQLTVELRKSERLMRKQEDELQVHFKRSTEQLPMMALEEITLEDLLRVEEITVGEENLVGVRVPVLEEIRFDVRSYSMLSKPHWVDEAVDRLREAVELKAQVRVARLRVKRLEKAVRRITQRVNLFEKILIPRTEEDIRKIQIYLGEAERAAVIRSKMMKALRQRKAQEIDSQESMPSAGSSEPDAE